MFASQFDETEASLLEGTARVDVKLCCLGVLAFLEELVGMETS